MSKNMSRGPFLLLLAVTLAASCGQPGERGAAQPFNSQGAAGDATRNRAGGGGSRDYSDPGGTFAITMPAGWKVEREEKDGAYMTTIRHEQHRAADLSILTIEDVSSRAGPAELRSHMLVEGSKPYFQGWLNGLSAQARVEGTGDIRPTRLDKFDALMMEVTYYKGDADDPRRGRCIFLSSEQTTFFISLTGSRPRFEELKEIISTMRVRS